MKKLLFLTLLFSCFFFNLRASQTASFKFYGYSDVSISGIKGQAVFYVKPDNIHDASKSVLHLNIDVSQAINRANSYINILINDQRAQSYSLSSIGSEVVIPFSGKIVDSQEYIKIDVQAQLSITDDRCKDMFNEALWMRVLNTSYIEWIEKDLTSIANIGLWDGFISTDIIAYPDQPDESDLNMVASIYTFLSTARSGKVELYPYSQLPKNASDILVVGQLDKIPPHLKKKVDLPISAKEGLIYLYRNIQDSIKQVLFVTGVDDLGYRKAGYACLNEHLLRSVYNNYTVVREINFNRNSYKFSNVPLSRLNNSNFLFKGVGSLSSVYNFRMADFGGFTGDGNIHLEAKYRPVSNPDKAYYNIYLNRLLLHSQELNQSGELILNVPFNDYQLLTVNTLTIEFLYYPGEGACQSGSDEFYAQQDIDKSGLEITAVKSPGHLSFKDFPEIFYTKNTKVFVSKNINPEQVKALALMMYRFNRNTYKDRFYFPEIYFSDKLTDSEIANNAIIGMLATNDPKNALFTNSIIQQGDNFRLFSSSNNKLMFNLSDNSNIGLAQIFYQSGNNPVVLLHGYGDDPSNMQYVAAYLNKNMADIESNICVADSTHTTFFNIDSYDISLKYDEEASFLSTFWNQYKLWIFVAGILLIGLSILYIQRKSKRSTDSIKNTREE